MDYRSAKEFLYEQLPIYQRQGQLAYKPDLGNIEALCAHYGDPQDRFPSIHIAGTNGKGSTAHIISSVLQEAGYRVGLHTQPHFLDLRERIRLNGTPCPSDHIAREVEAFRDRGPEIDASFFELILAFAFLYFAREKVDVAVIETGLGGRLDATNILHPELTVITNIGHDHMDLLGKDLASIAREKAGIIKQGTPLALGHIPDEALPVIRAKAEEMDAPLIWSEERKEGLPPCDLKGPFQEENLRTSISSIEALREGGWEIPDDAVEQGAKHVIPNTGIMGRWQVLRREPTVVADMGHNQEAVAAIRDALKEEGSGTLHWVFGTVEGKEWKEALHDLPKNARFYPCEADIPRAMPLEALREELASHGFYTHAHRDVQEAYHVALANASKNDIILIGGSAFVVAELLEKEGWKHEEE